MRSHPHRPTLLTMAACALCAGAAAQTAGDGLAVEAGLASLGGDTALFNQYRGLPSGGGTTLVLGARYLARDDVAGTTTRVDAGDVLGENRQFGLRVRQPATWALSFELREGVRRDPVRWNGALVGAGTPAPEVRVLADGPGSGSERDFKVKRGSAGVAYTVLLAPEWQVDLALKGEHRQGSRLFGIGMTCPSVVAVGCRGTTGTEAGWALLLLPEPIDTRHTEVEARATYAVEGFSLSAGYRGSFFQNANNALAPSVPGALYNPLGTTLPLSAGLQDILQQPVALAPDNQSHQVDLLGAYTVSPTTALNFKLVWAQALQDDSFGPFAGAPAGREGLQGRIDTTLVQAGISSRPWPKLSLAATVRWRDQEDHTPLALYNVEDTATYTNRQLSSTTLRAKANADYQIDPDLRGGVGAEYEAIDRGAFTPSSAVAGVSALRQKTDETTLRAQLRRRLATDFSGAIVVERSRRSGSNWLKDNGGLGVTEVQNPNDPANGFDRAIFMPTLADRERSRFRLSGHWLPSEALSMQVAIDDGRDTFRTPGEVGLRHQHSGQIALDADYAINEEWRLTGYLSHGEQTLLQSRPDAAIVAYGNVTQTLGLGLAGKPMSKLDLSASLSLIEDRSRYRQTLQPTASADLGVLLDATGGLPDIVFRQTALRLSGAYAVDKAQSLRVEFVGQRARWNDWAWNHDGTPFVYSDGSTVSLAPRQTMAFVGIAYTRRWP